MKCSSLFEKGKSTTRFSRPFGFISTVLVALLPKCNFCFIAYSSSLALCSGKKVMDSLNSWGMVIMIFLVSTTLIANLQNYRDIRTHWSLVLVILGISLVSLSFLGLLSSMHHYIGSVLMLFGIWVNGSFLFIFRRIKTLIF